MRKRLILFIELVVTSQNWPPLGSTSGVQGMEREGITVFGGAEGGSCRNPADADPLECVPLRGGNANFGGDEPPALWSERGCRDPLLSGSPTLLPFGDRAANNAVDCIVAVCALRLFSCFGFAPSLWQWRKRGALCSASSGMPKRGSRSRAPKST